MHHTLKTWPQYFQKVKDGEKSFEIRRNDRGFQEGDMLILQEWNQISESYTGREQIVRVKYITDFAQQDDYVVMSVVRVPCSKCGCMGGNGHVIDEEDSFPCPECDEGYPY